MTTVVGESLVDVVARGGHDELPVHPGGSPPMPPPRSAGSVAGGRGAAVVCDGVGLATFDATLAATRLGGMMVLYGESSGPAPSFELQRLAGADSLFITRPDMAHYIASWGNCCYCSGSHPRCLCS